MFFVVLVFPNILGSIGIGEGSQTSPFAVLEFPDIFSSIRVSEGSLTIWNIIMGLTYINPISFRVCR